MYVFTLYELNSFLEVTVLEEESTAPPIVVYLDAQTGVIQGHVKVSTTNIPHFVYPFSAKERTNNVPRRDHACPSGYLISITMSWI